MKIGKPRVWSDPKAMAKAINDYFTNPPTRKYTANGTEYDLPNITVTGLCIHLGFESRQSFYDYEKNKDYSYIIKRARLFIENEYESRLANSNVTGAIFALKNMGWKSEADVEDNAKRPIVVNIQNPYDEPKPN